MALGKDWRKVIEEGRKVASTAGHHPVPPLNWQKDDSGGKDGSTTSSDIMIEEEEFFSQVEWR